MKYEEFLSKKWNWNSVVNLDKENSIFNKEFGQIIDLRPLEVRTFLFYGVNFTDKCDSPSKLRVNDVKYSYLLDKNKAAPKR